MDIDNSKKGLFKKRYKRFFVEIENDNKEIVIAHCPNNGRMTGLNEINTKVIYSIINSPLGLQWQMAFIENTWIGINTMTPNRLFKEFFHQDPYKMFNKYDDTTIRGEYCISAINGDKHRIDFLINNCNINLETIEKHINPNNHIRYQKGNPILVEVKNVHWKRGEVAYFPDCVTTRGTSQLASLNKLSMDKYNILIFFVLQRNDCQEITIAKDIDPIFYNTIKNLIHHGAIVMGINCNVQPDGITYNQIIDFFID